MLNKEEKEKVFKFTECKSNTDCKDIYIKESKLEEKHIGLLCGELIKQYQELPKRAKILLKDYINQ